MNVRATALACLVVASTAPAQESESLFHAPRVVLPVDSAPFQKLGDFDGDGDLDVVGTRQHQSGTSGQVYVWRNDGGVLTPVLVTSTFQGAGQAYGTRSLAVVVADFNGDGLDDFAVAMRDRVDRYLAQPNLQFTVQPLWLVGAQPGSRAAAAGDFDADGLVDLAVAAPSNGVDQLYVFFATGAWTSTVVAAPQSAQSAVRLLVQDLDGQPGDDLLLFEHASAAANAYHVVGGQLAHQQQFFSTLTLVSPTPWLWTGGDVDGDGDDDLVVFKPAYTSSQQAKYEVFRRVGPAAFSPEAQAVGGPAEYLQDVDGDGDLDGVCCGGGGGGPNYQWPELDFASTFEIAPNDGTGAFATAWQFPGAGSESLAGAADLDGDGDLELVAGRCIFYGEGPWAEAPMPVAAGASAWGLARPRDLHDVDRDGDPDYRDVVNDGDGNFAPAPTEPLATANNYYSGYPIWCDVDGDGARDRVRMQSGQDVGMVWHRNNGGGHFEHAGLCAQAGVFLGSASQITLDTWFVADFDGDGDEDLAVHNTGELFWNQSGTFATTPEPLPAGYLQGVGDFDGDGLPDIAMSSGIEQKILLGTGQPGAAFVPGWSQTFAQVLPFEPSASLVTDVNGDGRDDVVCPHADGKLRLLINQTPPNGALAFVVQVLPSTPLWLSYGVTTAERPKVTCADFDGDGDLDFGLSRLVGQPNVYAVLLRDGSDPNVHLYHERRFAIRDGYAADLDGDGDVDLLGTNAIRNRTVARVDGGRRTQRHDAVVGEGGAAPVLGGTGPYRAGGSHAIHLTGVPGPTVALLGISIGDAFLVDAPLPGLTLYLDPNWMLVGALPITQNGQGRAAAMATATLPIFPGTAGWTFHLQAFVPDPAAPAQYTQSNLLSLRVGN
ncbi:MAG: FG-GAP repeat domain-containing protein [Planctomycetota bacterium]